MSQYFELPRMSVLTGHLHAAMAKRGCSLSKKETVVLVELFAEDDWKGENDSFRPICESHTVVVPESFMSSQLSATVQSEIRGQQGGSWK